MSILSADPWFSRGQTLGVKDATAGGAVAGSAKVFSDSDPRTSKAGEFLSNRLVTCIAARNVSGGALLPGAAVKFKAAAILTEVDGAAATASGLTGVVDEYLPASGVANNDIFWVVVSGPTTVTTSASLAAGASVTFTAGKAAASGTDPVVGYAISAPDSGKVRTLLTSTNGVSA